MVVPRQSSLQPKKGLIAVAMLASLAALSTVLACPPVRRTADYRHMISAYSTATPVPQAPSGVEQLRWDVELPIVKGAAARIQARGHMDVVKVHYSDEPEPRELYRYVDYSSPVAIRRDGHKLFVCWAETLFRTNYWLLEYDLERRCETQRRRVDPKDLSIR